MALSKFLFVAALGAAPAAQAADRSYSLTGFDKVEAAAASDVAITTGPAFAVRATGDADAIDRLVITVDNGTLKIGSKSDWGMGRRGEARVAVTMPRLTGVRVSGSADVTADRGAGPAFAAGVSGSGNVRIAAIDADDVRFSVSGSGNLTAAGRCRSFGAQVTGSGDIDAAALKCATAQVKVAGSGNLSAFASQTATVSVSGSGDVRITGGGRCTSSTAGSGVVTCN